MQRESVQRMCAPLFPLAFEAVLAITKSCAVYFDADLAAFTKSLQRVREIGLVSQATGPT
ncbi:MAG: hypothetical protein AAGC77_10710 [Pseudomonadota bacterium]